MHALDRVRLFSEQWHQGEWRARDLPDAVGAEVLWRDGGRNVLGFAVSYQEHRVIVLNARIRSTPAQPVITYHEAAHIIQGDLLGFCGNAWIERQCERNATYGSALLAIPMESAVMFAERHATVHDLADYYEVPPALVYMRGALAIVLGEVDGDRERARQQLAAARRSLASWIAAVARGI